MQPESDKQHHTSDPLQDSEALLRTMIENLPGGAAFVVDPDLCYRLAEGEALSVAGFKPEDMVGHTIFEVLPPDLATSYEVLYRKALAGEAFEHEHSAHDRSYISRGTPLRSANGEVYAVLVVSYDITDRRQAEAAVAADLEDTQRLRELSVRLVAFDDIQTLYQEIVTTAIALTRADAGSVQILDEATQDLVLLATQGATPEMIEHFHRVNARSNTSCGMALVTGDRTRVDFDVPQSEDPDGSMRMHVEAGYLSVQSTPLITRSGKAIGMVSTHWRKHHRPTERELRFLDLLARQAADLIEQQQAQVALRESEARFKSAFSNNMVAMGVWTTTGDITDANDALLDLIGYTRAELEAGSIRWTGLTPPEYQNRDEQAVAEVEANGVCTPYEKEFIHKDGYRIPILIGGGRFDDRKGRGILCAFDLSDRKRAEEALRESEQNLSGVANIVPDLLWNSEPDGSTNWYNDRWMEYTGQTFEQAIGWGWADAIHPDDRETSVRSYREAVEESRLLQQEHRIRRRDGVYRWFLVRVEPLRDEQGRVVRMYGAATDIHEQRLALEALRESEALLQKTISIETLGVLFFSLNGRMTGVNEAFVQMSGYSRDELLNTVDWEVLTPPEFMDVTTRVAEELATGGETAPYEKQMLRKDGSRWWGLFAPTRLRGSGSESECVEFVIDISDRKRTEITLHESEEKYRSLFNSIDEGFLLCDVIFDENDRPVDIFYPEANPAAIRIVGQDLTGRYLSEIDPNFESYWFEIWGRVAQTGKAERLELYAQALGIWLDFYVFKLDDTDSRRVAVIFNDITDRKQAEEQLRRGAEMDAFRVKLSDALRSLTDPVEIQSVAMRVLGEHLQVDRVLYAEIERDDETLVIHDNYVNHDVPKIVGQFRISDFPQASGKLRAGQCVIISDVVTDPELTEVDRASLAALSIRSTIVVPLIKGGRWVVNMGIYHTTARAWSEDDIVLLEETAERTWAAVERAHVEDALRESEIQLIREQAAREEERQRAETLAELDRAKTLFFSNVSHEFRTPLTLLLAPLQDALNDRTHPLAPPQRERLELAHRNTNRLLKLVNTLLDFSRIEAGRMEAVYEPTDLAMFTTELASVFRSAIERVGLRLIVDCPPLSEPVYVDRQMWEKIVLNLLSNAFKFTLEGEITVRLHPTDGNRAIFQIQDTGTGIAPKHLPHLFERFYQVRGTEARTHEGSGIGLALVDELVRLHGGTIEVSSTLGEGTCFTIALPFGTDHLPSDRLHLEGDRIQPTRTLTSTAISVTSYVEEVDLWLPTEKDQHREIGKVEEQSAPTSDCSLPTSTSARVLLVDDNADMREYLTRILSEHVQVEAVAHGAAALAAIRERVPDLVLSDVMMPGLDGFGLLQTLRASPRTREVPIILLSARAGEEAIVEGLEAGADDYLIKPFWAQELVSRVNAHLQMAQLRGEALQEARSMIRSRDEMISTVSHELNTPLVSILGWTRMLRSNPPNPVMLTKALDTIERNATLQAKLVQDLLDMSRITAGKLRLNPQPIKLESVIETAIATVTQTAADKGIHLTWQENITEPVVVMGDSDRLQQVVCNLLTNAIKFTPASGSVTLELSLINADHSADDSYAEIRVTDTGIGITADFLPHVFDRFRQARDSDAAKGLGLGLAIAQHLVELHNGTIHAESAGEGQGASFIVRLPLLSPMPHDQSPMT